MYSVHVGLVINITLYTSSVLRDYCVRLAAPFRHPSIFHVFAPSSALQKDDNYFFACLIFPGSTGCEGVPFFTTFSLYMAAYLIRVWRSHHLQTKQFFETLAQ